MSKVDDLENVALESRSVDAGSERRSPRMACAVNGGMDVASAAEEVVIVGVVDEANTVLYLSTIALEISMPNA